MSTDEKMSDEDVKRFMKVYNFYEGMTNVASESCKSLGLPEDFFSDISDESDWVFVIKLSGLFEAAIAQMIVSSLKRPELDEVIHNLSYSGKNGKLEFCKSLNLLNPERLKFLSALSQIRNHFAHGLSSIRSTLVQYYDGLSPDKQESFRARFFSFQVGREEMRKLTDEGEKQRKLQLVLFSESVLTLKEISRSLK